jgi:monoamine oxidase
VLHLREAEKAPNASKTSAFDDARRLHGGMAILVEALAGALPASAGISVTSWRACAIAATG